jgi:prolyl oligopeptidase
MKIKFPETKIVTLKDDLYGTTIVDNYRWLEDSKDPAVKAWTEEQEKLARKYLDKIPQRDFLVKRFNELWRYDDETLPDSVIDGDRIFLYTKKKDQDKWALCTKKDETSPLTVLIDPNEWDKKDSLDGCSYSRDGKFVAFGKSPGGSENPVVSVMEVETKKILPEKLKGQRQRVTDWLLDNSGFYYNANPLKGEVPEGEENYWQSAYFHKLGTSTESDVKVFYHDKIKEHYHTVVLSDDGKYEIYYRSMFNKNELYFKKANSNDPLIPLVDEFKFQYFAQFVEDKILIITDEDAPLYKVFITDIKKPQKANWKEFLHEDPKDRLESIQTIGRHIYAIYKHNAYTQIKIFDLSGKHLQDISFPTLGTGGVKGQWSKDEVYAWFSSFTYPMTKYKYDFATNKLILYRKFPIEIDVEKFTTEQIWYESKDKTKISMFLVNRKDLVKNSKNPVMLTGYGGFNVPVEPGFSTIYVAWLEAGGMIAIPNLRGGGEYGRAWHEAGMKEKKQNVFDDFIYAAEWLIKNKFTNPEKLSISGGSNGGLLMGAAITQRPDLFKACLCTVPLLDMIRFHKVGFANVWVEEYGSPDNPDDFKYIYKYSPYQNVKDGTSYPATLFVGSENDARVDPFHSRKMTARMQAAQAGNNPILLLVLKDSGHGGGTTLSVLIQQIADDYSFLMYEIGMKVPK